MSPNEAWSAFTVNTNAYPFGFSGDGGAQAQANRGKCLPHPRSGPFHPPVAEHLPLTLASALEDRRTRKRVLDYDGLKKESFPA